MFWKSFIGAALLFCFLLLSIEAYSQTTSPVSNPSISVEDSIQLTGLYSRIKTYKQSDPAKAIELAEDALHLSKQIKNQKFIATSMRKIAQLYDASGKTGMAIKYYDSSIVIFDEGGFKKGLSYSYSNLGRVYLHLGNIEKAWYNFQKALTLGEEMNDSLVICTGYNNFGNIYYNQYDYAHAISNYQKAFSMAQKINKKSWLGDYAANIGNANYMQGNNQSALEYYEKAISYYARTNNDFGTAQVFNSLGQVFESEGNYTQAIEYYQKSLTLKKKIQDTRGESECLTNIAGLYNNMGDYDQSLKYSFKSLEISEPSGLLEQMKCSYENLYVSYSQKNDFDKALEYYTQFKDMEKEIFLKANNETIARLQTQYETEKKEKEIAQLTRKTESQNILLLRQKNYRNILFLIIVIVVIIMAGLGMRYLSKKRMNQILVRKNEEIEQQKRAVEQLNNDLKEINVAKDKFFAIISHDLKNPINLLSTSTAYMLKNLYETDKAKLEIYLTNMDKSAHALELLLLNLLNWAQSQLGTLSFNPQKLSVRELASQCVKALEPIASQKRILLHSNISSSICVFADRDMIRTVLRNLVSNAIKFTNEGGRVEILAIPAGERVVINSRDNGIGMTKTTINKLFQISRKESTLGTANEKGTGVGMILCKEQIGKTNGELKIESVPGKCSLVGFSLPACAD